MRTLRRTEESDMNLTLHEVAHLVHAKNDISQFEDVALIKPEFDSRLIGPGDLFVPLKGARDGHDFIELNLKSEIKSK